MIDLHPGRAVALTGPSGSGKTTLLNGIAALDPVEGAHLAGRSPTAWHERSLRRRVAMLAQRSALVSGTIRDNLYLAGSVDDAALWRNLDVVALAGTIRARGGLDARLGEGGSGLSGGQPTLILPPL